MTNDQRHKRSKANPETLSNSKNSKKNAEQEYTPPLEALAKYSTTKPNMQNQNYLKSKNIRDKKLAHHLQALSSTSKANATKAHEHDDLLLSHSNAGLMQPEHEMERTWKVTQQEIIDSSAESAASKHFSLKLEDFGPYSIDYTRNGRHLALAGRKGHVATFDWQSGKLHSEIQLKETVRAIKWLHNESFYAVAQRKYVYIYDQSGLEVHQLKNHIEVNQMEFLPYHFLLATIGNPGFLKYQDTSTGQCVAEFRTKLGACQTMAQNAHNAFIHLGHQNGRVTLWSPSVSRAQVQLQAHRGPVSAISIDSSTLGTRMVTCGLDGDVKIWDTRKWAVLNEYNFKKTPTSAAWSQKGLLSVAWGNHVSVFSDLNKPNENARAPPPPYMVQHFPGTPVSDIRFCPYDDILGVGHSSGFTSLIVPGSGEPNFDTLEADPYEGKRRRQEREIHALINKVPYDLITLDTDLIGKVDNEVIKRSKELDIDNAEDGRALTGHGGKKVPYAKRSRMERIKIDGKAIEEENESESEDDMDLDEAQIEEKRQKSLAKADAKKRARGRNSTLKKMLRKRRRNVIDPQTVALKEKIARGKVAAEKARANALAAKSASSGTDSALSRFKF